MPELLVDQGNTGVKLGWLEEGRLRLLDAQPNEADLLHRIPARPHRIWLSSVAGAARAGRLRAELEKQGTELIEVRIERYQRHLPTRYATDQLGVDRWLAALAGFERARGACVVVDAGTATTIDLVGADGIHRGGYILPGEGLAARALTQGTAIDLGEARARCSAEMPRDTAEAIRCGSLAAQAALIDRTREMMDGRCEMFVGGGNREALAPYLESDYLGVPQLVLEGLACLARREASCAG